MTCIKAISVSINFIITAATSISLETVDHIATNMEFKTIVKVVIVHADTTSYTSKRISVYHCKSFNSRHNTNSPVLSLT